MKESDETAGGSDLFDGEAYKTARGELLELMDLVQPHLERAAPSGVLAKFAELHTIVKSDRCHEFYPIHGLLANITENLARFARALPLNVSEMDADYFSNFEDFLRQKIADGPGNKQTFENQRQRAAMRQDAEFFPTN